MRGSAERASRYGSSRSVATGLVASAARKKGTRSRSRHSAHSSVLVHCQFSTISSMSDKIDDFELIEKKCGEYFLSVTIGDKLQNHQRAKSRSKTKSTSSPRFSRIKQSEQNERRNCSRYRFRPRFAATETGSSGNECRFLRFRV